MLYYLLIYILLYLLLSNSNTYISYVSPIKTHFLCRGRGCGRGREYTNYILIYDIRSACKTVINGILSTWKTNIKYIHQCNKEITAGRRVFIDGGRKVSVDIL